VRRSGAHTGYFAVLRVRSIGEEDSGLNGAFLMLAMWLQSAGAGSFGLSSLSGLALPILFFVVLYFLMIAPNQRKQKKWQEMLGQLKSGDRVTTNGGIKGTVLTVKDDVVVLKVQPDGVKLEFVKSAIAAVTTDEQAA
jgi:preprotein translocase subunit YajC